MTEREAALCDLAYAHGMKAASVMLAQGADERVRQIMEHLHSSALHTLRRPVRMDVAALCERHAHGEAVHSDKER